MLSPCCLLSLQGGTLDLPCKLCAPIIARLQQFEDVQRFLGKRAEKKSASLEEAQPEQPSAEILDLLKASAEPLSPAQIAKALEKNSNTIRALLARLVREGAIQMVRFGKYGLPVTPINDVVVVNFDTSPPLKRDEQDNKQLLLEKRMSSPETKEFTTTTSLTPVQKPEAATKEAEGNEAISLAAPPRLSKNRFASTVAGATGSTPLPNQRKRD